MPLWVMKDGKHNKYWRYDVVSETAIRITFGRIGVTNPPNDQTFHSAYERDRFIEKKVAEKVKKGYRPEEEEKLSQDSEIARQLGVHNKVQRTEFVSLDDATKKLLFLGGYDPDQYVYAEILNSNSKEVTHVLLNRTHSWTLSGVNANGEVSFARKVQASGDFISGVRAYLRSLASLVREVVRAKIGSLGSRKLDLGDEQDEMIPARGSMQESAVLSSFSNSSASAQVVTKFAAMGSRKLDL